MLSAALLTKLLVAPLLIGLASLAGKRWGPAVSGLLGGLPLVGAPVVLALWLGQGFETAHHAAITAPIGVWATMSYLLTFGFASARWHWLGTFAASWAVYLGVACLLHFSGLDQQRFMAYAILPVLWMAAIHWLPHPAIEPAPVHLPRLELLARMLAAVALVSALTAAAAVIGPDMTGVFAGAPVAASVIPVFTLITAGRDPVLRVLRGFLSGQMGFAVFFLIFAAAMPQWRAWALLPALLGGVVVGFAGAALIRWRLTARPRLVGTQS